MATVFAELERSMIRSRVMAGLDRVRAEGKKTLGRPQVGRTVEHAIRQQLAAEHGILKVAKIVGVGSGTVQRVRCSATIWMRGVLPHPGMLPNGLGHCLTRMLPARGNSVNGVSRSL
jgi:hypothetical protein